MARRVAHLVLGLLAAALGSTTACSNSDSGSPALGTGGSADAGAGVDTGGTGAHAGSKAMNGGAANAGATAQGAAGAHEGGAAHDGSSGARGALNEAGAGAAGGAEPLAQAGAGGAAGEVEMPGPPDLITSSGGPWPDSLTGACANATKVIACPQKDDPFFGQDGTYRINVPKYTMTSTTMKDSVTGLIWQLKPEQLEKTQAAALAYCDGLSLGGQTDWRLPTRLEYVSVLDEGMGSGSAMPPAIPLDTQGAHWTASATGKTAGQFFVMDDAHGIWTVAVDTTPLSARCVRGTPLSGALTVEGDVVTDSMTKLTWQTSALDDSARDWQAALEYCETLSHAGKDDWRLPSIKELSTLVDETATMAPVISADFGSGTASQYWSSTPARTFGDERFALALDTSFGISPSLKMADSAAAARCVRTAD